MAYNIPPPVNTGSTFPTFLDEDPFPSPRDGRPTSSAGSDATSEFEARSIVASTTGPVGEPGLPPSRPSTNTGNPRASLNPPPSRRGLGAFSRDGSSRPGSALGQTHVPSLPAQGFFRPMSPHALQAQRGQTATPDNRQSFLSHQRTVSVEEEEEPEPETRSNRYSTASVMTERDARPSTAADENIPPLPTSRGLSIATSTGDPSGIQTGSVISKNSTTPLNMKLVHEQNKFRGNTNSPAPKSPKSLRASLGFGSRNSSQRIMPERKPSKSHEKLSSDPSSPAGLASEKALPYSQPKAAAKANGKNYEYFAGNMLFFLSGRFLNTRARPLNVATFILTVLPAALFFVFSAPWLWHNISPAIPVVFAYIFYLAISAFLHAAFSDPGILPRNLHPHPPNPDEDRDPLTPGPATTEWVMVKTFPGSVKQSHEESGQPTTAMEVPTKYCKSCAIWRPPRAHHCRVCDACIETQDHHCVWLNNCVGRRNYRFFFAYVGFSSVLALLLLAFSLVHIGYYAQRNNITFGESLSGRTQERVAFAMFFYSLLALPYPGSLFGYHLFLIARGETTREYLNSHKFLPADRHRPFSQSSIFANWVAVLCRPRPPTYMAFRRAYVDGDVRMGHTKRRRDRIEGAKLDAARRDSRVEGMKNRFSVQKGETNRNGDVEMKPLPSPPGAGNAETKPLPTKPNKTNGSGIGNLNSTPR